MDILFNEIEKCFERVSYLYEIMDYTLVLENPDNYSTLETVVGRHWIQLGVLQKDYSVFRKSIYLKIIPESWLGIKGFIVLNIIQDQKESDIIKLEIIHPKILDLSCEDIDLLRISCIDYINLIIKKLDHELGSFLW